MSFDVLLTISRLALVIAGILMGAGGFIGYKKAGSKASLIAGVSSSILLLISTLATFIHAQAGLIGASVTLLALEMMFVVRLFKTKKFMPSGMLLLISALCHASVVLALLKSYGCI